MTFEERQRIRREIDQRRRELLGIRGHRAQCIAFSYRRERCRRLALADERFCRLHLTRRQAA